MRFRSATAQSTKWVACGPPRLHRTADEGRARDGSTPASEVNVEGTPVPTSHDGGVDF